MLEWLISKLQGDTDIRGFTVTQHIDEIYDRCDFLYKELNEARQSANYAKALVLELSKDIARLESRIRALEKETNG